MNEPAATFSVIVPAYNAGRHLRAALESIAAESRRDRVSAFTGAASPVMFSRPPAQAAVRADRWVREAQERLATAGGLRKD